MSSTTRFSICGFIFFKILSSLASPPCFSSHLNSFYFTLNELVAAFSLVFLVSTSIRDFFSWSFDIWRLFTLDHGLHFLNSLWLYATFLICNFNHFSYDEALEAQKQLFVFLKSIFSYLLLSCCFSFLKMRRTKLYRQSYILIWQYILLYIKKSSALERGQWKSA